MPFTAAKKASIRGVNVAKRSQYPTHDETIVYTFGQNMATALGGAIGALATADGDDREEFRYFLATHQIDPGLLMGEAFEKAYRAAPVVPMADKGADASFEFRIRMAGLMIPHGYSRSLCPYLSAEGKLVRRDGAVLWQQLSWIRDTDVRHSLDEYLHNPEVLRAAFHSAAVKLAREFVGDLHRQSGGMDPREAAERAAEEREDQLWEQRQEEKRRARETRR